MRKIINDPPDFVDEMIAGVLLAHPELRAASPDLRALVRADAPRPGKVGIVTGGGSGHLPVFLGYLGPGFCDGVAIGNVFSSPSAAQVQAATAAVSAGAGVLYLYGNYGGDIYNFDLAGDLAATQGIRTVTVLASDDVASAGPDRRAARRGVAGMVFAFKVAGAAAERGDDLDTVAAIARRAGARTATMGVGLSPTILPAAGEPTFEIDEGDMELGIGIHGEPGVHRGPLQPADDIADRLLEQILADLELTAGDEVAVLVNGLGATPLEELYVLYRRAYQVLADRGIVARRPLIGNFVTSLEMAGASISVLALDPELLELLEAPARTPFFDTWAHAPGPEHRVPRTMPAPAAAGEGTIHPEGAAGAGLGWPAAPSPLGTLLEAALTGMPGYADQLRELDGALGDGDLGITITQGCAAAAAAVRDFAGAPDSVLLHHAAVAFASANPSTFAALVGGGVIRAAAQLGPERPLDASTVLEFTQAVADRIADRGGAAAGDKTVLDTLGATIEVLRASPGGSGARLLDSVIDAADKTFTRMTQERSARGRAAWLGDRSIGRPDPGMAAYLGFLRELRSAMAAGGS
jgi:dihydroxyacetone kinase